MSKLSHPGIEPMANDYRTREPDITSCQTVPPLCDNRWPKVRFPREVCNLLAPRLVHGGNLFHGIDGRSQWPSTLITAL